MSVSHAAPSRVAMSWDDYRYVQAVAETRSLTGAAARLGVNHSTVFRRVNAIEEALGARVFERGRSGYALTAAGEEMVAVAMRVGEEIVDFERRIAGRDLKPSGELRVTTNDTIMVHLMTPVFASFLRAYPDIQLDIVVSNTSLNLSKRDADVAIRATATPPDSLVGRRVGTISWAAYGPARLAGRDLLDIFKERWLGLGEHLTQLLPGQWIEEHVPAGNIVMRLNTILGLAEATEAGIGVSMLPCFIGDQITSLARLSEPMSRGGELGSVHVRGVISGAH